MENLQNIMMLMVQNMEMVILIIMKIQNILLIVIYLMIYFIIREVGQEHSI